jgi:hypothetical protein
MFRCFRQHFGSEQLNLPDDLLCRKEAATMRAASQTQTVSNSDGTIKTAPESASEPRRTTHHVTRGQIVILLAGALIGLIGMIGLATDLGYAFAERRTMQNAADAGAIAGAHTISKSTTNAPLIVLSDVRETAEANRIGSAHPTVTYCQYVADDNTKLGSCSDPVPVGATGVSVTVKETHKTFFIGIIPGGPNTVSTQASATAHVQLLQGLPGDGPFLVCGLDPDVINGNGHGSDIDILIPNPSVPDPNATGHWILNPDANGAVFEIHGPQINHCGLQASNFKGAALQQSNKTLQVPNWFSFSNGDNAGPITQSVLGIQGCQANGQPVNNCVAFLPIALPADSQTQAAHPGQLWTVMIVPFYIQQIGSNKHYGTLIGNYVVEGAGSPGWTPDNPLPSVIRLTQ